MKIRLLYFLILLLPASLKAQETTEQPTQAFPFNITLFRPDSTPVSSAQVLGAGKVTVLAFWLTTCMPCQMEFAAYSQQYPEWQKRPDFQLIGVSIDFPQRFRQIAPMVKDRGWPFPIYWDRERVFRDILPGGLNGLPQVFVFDKKGVLAWRHKGYYTGFEQELWRQVQLAAAR